MSHSLTFWTRPSTGLRWSNQPAPTRPQVVRAIATLSAVMVGTGGGSFYIFFYIATHDIDWTQRSNVTLAGLGGMLALTAVGLTYALVNHLWRRSRLRTEHRSRRNAPRKAALSLDDRGFKHWAARPTRPLIPWSNIDRWFIQNDTIRVELDQTRGRAQSVVIPLSEIDAPRSKVIAAFERFCESPPQR
ncbi:hypothetical protein [Myceligenerans salitolerans]|uniref:YcxB-like protein domain-containing protein n=1 Tax=Myceligenerans salitolerans TaxID=1230528 RepID=A0ABS3IA92_9MICO|nr:hypothetical protein [Myceligenerans salitolerans]MBO0609860.1 hypothetical protein [Myceligenerans salitolerans]